MPMIIVRYITPTPRPELRARIAELASRLGAEKLGKDRSVTAMLIEEADPKGWFIGDRNPTDEGLSAFWMDFKITTGTNTKDETTAFVKATFEGMEALLGQLHEECYVLVHAADGDAYGYGGRTQNGRWAASHPG
jgi:4-oxalocrotonate tautomerase